MKKLLLLTCFHWIFLASWANHLVGGELFYSYKGLSVSGKPLYKITLRFFRNMEANVPSINNEPVYIDIHSNNHLVTSVTLPFEKVDTVKSSHFPSCVNTSLQTIYEVGYFSADVEMPSASADYTLSWARCCRTNNIDNMKLNDDGITLTAMIPGTALVGNQPNNSSIFPLKDTILLCNNLPFQIDFGAFDIDRDSLSYEFFTALDGGSLFETAPRNQNPLELIPLVYKGPQFSAASPLGSGVQLNPVTGQISGIAPAAGTYLVTVRVYEWRNGQIINQHSKDILLRVKNCSYSVAQLKPDYVVCNNSTLSISNEFPGGAADTWSWDFGVPGIDSDTSDLEHPQFVYADPGSYTVTLTVNKDKPCPATAKARVNVFLGLKSGFTVHDSCVSAQVRFTDTSQYTSGIINRWLWDFGEPQSSGNTSVQQNPVHRYTTSGLKMIRLITGAENGCMDTSFRQLLVLPHPDLSLAQHSLSVCRGDTVQLKASGNGSFLWKPDGGVSDPQSADPFAAPAVTTIYSVTLTNELGCSIEDSVALTVLPHDNIHIQPVPAICSGDTIQLNAITNATAVEWRTSADLFHSDSYAPRTAPTEDTWFYAIANPGLCQKIDSVQVIVLSSPKLNAGPDRYIKEDEVVTLSATGADLYHWSPATGLSNTNIPDPFVKLPVGLDSITYIVTGKLLNGCIRKDTLNIHVAIVPFAGAPTAFTPNGDGKNDIFKPIVKGGYQLVDFAVYSRWGRMVFQTNEMGKGWDGTVNQQPAAAGVYVWMVRARNKTSGQVVFKENTVTLIR